MISEDSYKQKYHSVEKKDEESIIKSVVQLNYVFQKWTWRSCEMVEQLADLPVMVQLLNTHSLSMKIWVEERRPKTAKEEAQLASNSVNETVQVDQGKVRMDPQSKKQCHTGICKQPGHFDKHCSWGSGRSERTTTGKNGKEPKPNGVVWNWTDVECYMCS